VVFAELAGGTTRNGDGGEHMQVVNRAAHIAGVLVMVLAATPMAQAQTATFSDVTDAVPDRFFNAATTTVDPADWNRLIIGFNTGTDPKTFTPRDFKASGTGAGYRYAMDTLSFEVLAPQGYYVATITYSQKGSGSVIRTGQAQGGADWMVAGFTAPLGRFTTNPTLSQTTDLTYEYLTSVRVSISVGLSAYATSSGGSATVGITSADVVVQLLPLPY
jgi:hypothetical protein